MRDFKELNQEELEVFLRDGGFPGFHARQILIWVYQKNASDFSRMSNLPKALRERLQKNFNIFSLKIEKKVVSKDGTEKFLFGLLDNERVEAVLIPTATRVTGCISSQVGCKFACRFCASGVSGLKRNLSTAEIMEQVLSLKNNSAGKLTHIVFMGTGEPLDNYDFVLKAVRILNSDYSFNIGARRITLSTCGLIPGINRLAEEGLQIELSVSLHAADDKLRDRLMPVNKKYPLRDLMRSCKEYIDKTGRQITFEYILIRGVNSDLQNARNLCKILSGLRLAKVNLIPSNRIEELKVEPPDKKEIVLFRDFILKQGLPVTVRRPRGEDIEAACGQLRLRYENKS